VIQSYPRLTFKYISSLNARQHYLQRRLINVLVVFKHKHRTTHSGPQITTTFAPERKNQLVNSTRPGSLRNEQNCT
jgi:hypothetical protein